MICTSKICLIFLPYAWRIISIFNTQHVKAAFCYPQPFPKGQILDSSELKEFADDNSKFDENSRWSSKWVENTVGKKRNCSIRAISLFPHSVF